LRCVIDDPFERAFRVLRIVKTIAVSRFYQQIVAGGRRNWVANYRLIVVAQVSRKQNSAAALIVAGIFDLYKDET